MIDLNSANHPSEFIFPRKLLKDLLCFVTSNPVAYFAVVPVLLLAVDVTCHIPVMLSMSVSITNSSDPFQHGNG